MTTYIIESHSFNTVLGGRLIQQSFSMFSENEEEQAVVFYKMRPTIELLKGIGCLKAHCCVSDSVEKFSNTPPRMQRRLLSIRTPRLPQLCFCTFLLASSQVPQPQFIPLHMVTRNLSSSPLLVSRHRRGTLQHHQRSPDPNTSTGHEKRNVWRV